MAVKLDPRLAELAGEPNSTDRMMAWSIRRALYTLRLANGESRKILKFLNRELYPEVIRQLRDRLDTIDERGPQYSTATDARLGALARQLRAALDQKYAEAHDKLAPELAAQAGSEAAAVVGRLNAFLPAVSVEAVLPQVATLRAIVSSSTFNGNLLRDWFNVESQRTADGINRTLNVGIAQGQPADQIIRAIRGTAALDFEDGLLDASRRQIETLVRTAVRHTQEEARQITYRENEDVLGAYQVVATLDTRTCPICMGLDGQVYEFDNRLARRPPFHPNCRCTTVPVVKKIAGLPPGQRASATGAVPDTMTYPEWLKTQPESVQDDALGPRRAELWRAGKLDIGDFADSKDHILTLKQLDALEAKLN